MGFLLLSRSGARRRATVQCTVAQRHARGRPRAAQALRCFAAGVALAFVLTGAPVAFAAEPDPGEDIASIRDWLWAHNPQLRAMQAETDAADARILPAGALPDPMASVWLQEIDPDQPSLLPGNVGSTTYMLQQRFPLWGKRGLAREVARGEARATGYERDAMALDLVGQAEAAYVRYWHARESVTVIDRLIALLEQVEEIAGVRYALGMAAQQDSIRAQVARTGMQRERIERLATRGEATAALNAVLGRRADAALAEPTSHPVLPVEDSTLAAALQRLERGDHPALQASTAMATAANRNVELVRRDRYPDVTLGVGAMQRGNRLSGYELRLEVEIPFQQRARRERERGSRLLEDAALDRTEAARTELQGRLGSAWARWIGAREQQQLIEKTLLPQADANFQSALASYQVGEVDFGTLLDSLREWQGADLARVDATRDELLGAAAVRAIDGDAR